MRDARKEWDALAGVIDPERHAEIAKKLAIQERDAIYWRDACLLYFQTFSKRPAASRRREAAENARRVQGDKSHLVKSVPRAVASAASTKDPLMTPRSRPLAVLISKRYEDHRHQSDNRHPLEAPLRHANGCHWGRFVRTVVEIVTDEGLIGLGEMGGGGESAEAVFRAMKSYLVGHDPAHLEEMRFLIANPTASLYNNRTQILAALEFACLDLLGQKWGRAGF